MTKEVKLDALGSEMEKALTGMLKQVMKPQGLETPPDERISMLDKLRVIDRVLKWQGIKLKADDDEGGFFNFEDKDEDGEASPPKGKWKKGQSSGTGHFGDGS